MKRVNRTYLLITAMLFCAMDSSCQDVDRTAISPNLEVSYKLGDSYFPLLKDTTSFLPDELLYDSLSIFFIEKSSRALIEFNVNSKKNVLITEIGEILKTYKSKKAALNSIKQLSVNSNEIQIFFGDRLFKFNRQGHQFLRSFELSPFSYCIFNARDGGYISISQSGSFAKRFSAEGNFREQIKLGISNFGFFVSTQDQVYCSNSLDVVELNYDSLAAGRVMKRPLSFNSDESQKYVLMAAAKDYLIWSDITDINTLILTNLASGRIEKIYEIDRAILKSKEITRIPASNEPSADPPEQRQYLRVASDGKRIYIMFQAKGYIRLYSFAAK